MSLCLCLKITSVCVERHLFLPKSIRNCGKEGKAILFIFAIHNEELRKCPWQLKIEEITKCTFIQTEYSVHTHTKKTYLVSDSVDDMCMQYSCHGCVYNEARDERNIHEKSLIKIQLGNMLEKNHKEKRYTTTYQQCLS